MQSSGQTVLFVGDLSYADRYQQNDIGSRWDSWGRLIERSAAYQPWIWCAGNHEIEYMPEMVMLTRFSGLHPLGSKVYHCSLSFYVVKPLIHVICQNCRRRLFHLNHIYKDMLLRMWPRKVAILCGMP